MKKLVLALLALLALPLRATQLTGTIKYASGAAVTGTLTLTPSQRMNVLALGGCGGPLTVLPEAPFRIPIFAGVVPSTSIVGNDCVQPSNTYYAARMVDAAGRVVIAENWRITGAAVNVAGILPLLGPPSSQQTLNGDVTGDVSASTVARIQGFPVSTTAPVNGQILLFNGTQWAPGSTAGTGTVTSVDVAAPSIFTVSGGPITSAGVITLALAPVPAGAVLIGPVSGSDDVPTIRVLQSSDIPDIPESRVTGLVTDLNGKVSTSRTVGTGAGLAGGGALTSDLTLSIPAGGVSDTMLSSTAGSTNAPSTIVKRDALGGFAAGTIVANVTGNVTGTATGFSGQLAGDVEGTQASTQVVLVGGSTAAQVHSAELAANAAVSSNTLGAIVKRDGSGDFAAHTITANLTGNATNVTGTVAIANGGTGQTVASGAFNALSPVTLAGDLIVGTGTNANSRLGGNTSTTPQLLVSTGNGSLAAPPVWRALLASDIPAIAESGVTSLVSDLAGKVPTTRSVATGTGLSGGGTLAGDLSLGLVPCVAAGAGHAKGAVPDPGATANGYFLRDDCTFAAAPASAISSITVTVPTNEMVIAGSPLIASGTLAFDWKAQTANKVFAGPTSGGSTLPGFRLLVDADIPAIPESRVTNLTGDLAALVPKTTHVDTTLPLTGGGALSGTLTLNVNPFSASGVGHAAGVVPDPGASGGTTKFLREDASFQTAVTSAGLSMPAEFSVANSPLTTSGTLAVTKANETANQVWAGPTTGSPAAPAFRALVDADIPAIPESRVTSLVSDLAGKTPTTRLVSTTLPLTGGGDLSADRTLGINVFGASGGSHSTGAVPDPGASAGTTKVLFENASWGTAVTSVSFTPTAEFTVAGSPVTTSGGFTLSKVSQGQNTFWAAPSGAGGVPSFRIIDSSDVPALPESRITNLTTDLAARALTATTISTTAPLAGGGDLSANRTFSLNLNANASLSTTGGLGVATGGVTEAMLATAVTSAATASTIVKRDASADFAAHNITANSFIGNVTGSAASFTGSLVGDVTGTQGATVVSTVGTSSATNVHNAEVAANAATSSGTVSTIAKRDANGDFTMHTLTLTGTLVGGGGPVLQTRQINTTAPLTGGGDLTADRTIAIPVADNSTNGYLSSTDHTNLVFRDGTRALTAAWNAGNFNITAKNAYGGFNVQAYGAVGDGTTDDSTAINAAVAAAATTGGNVIFPWTSSGYRIAQPIIVANDNVTLTGLGNPRIFAAPGGMGVSNLVIQYGGSGCTGTPGVSFSGGGSGSNAAGTATRSGAGIIFINLTNSGQNYTSAPNVSVTGNGCTNVAVAAITSLISIGNGQTPRRRNVRVEGLILDGNGVASAGITTNYARDITIRGVKILNTGVAAIEVTDTTGVASPTLVGGDYDVRIRDSWLAVNTGAAVWAWGDNNNLSITGCTIDSNGGSIGAVAIGLVVPVLNTVVGMKGVQIANNTIRWNGPSSIVLNGGESAVTIEGNHMVAGNFGGGEDAPGGAGGAPDRLVKIGVNSTTYSVRIVGNTFAESTPATQGYPVVNSSTQGAITFSGNVLATAFATGAMEMANDVGAGIWENNWRSGSAFNVKPSSLKNWVITNSSATTTGVITAQNTAAGGTPGLSSATGLGSGSAAVGSGSLDTAGTIVFSPSGSPSASGSITLTSSSSTQYLANPVVVATLMSGTGTWNARATAVVTSVNNGVAVFAWDNNSVNLTAGSTYILNYVVIGR